MSGLPQGVTLNQLITHRHTRGACSPNIDVSRKRIELYARCQRKTRDSVDDDQVNSRSWMPVPALSIFKVMDATSMSTSTLQAVDSKR